MKQSKLGVGAVLLFCLVLSARGMKAQDVNVDGNLLMHNSTSTVGNVLKDGTRFIHNFGLRNTFLGENSGNLTMSGQGNAAVGFNALMSNTHGTSNAAIGDAALLSNTEGNGNSAIGSFALFSNSIGSDNTAAGREALVNNTQGSGNTAMGSGTLVNNTTGILNTATGEGALQRNTTGADNTGCGGFALYGNTTGDGNTGMGQGALAHNATGFSNTALGSGADVAYDNLNNATAIGVGSLVNASNKIRLGNTDITVIEGQVPYTFTSDKNQKENFLPVNGQEVLRKIRELNLTSWNYMGHDPKQFRHYGPVAQEFFAAFGHDSLGTVGTATTINSGDMEGILMVAAQALEQRTSALEKEKEILKQTLEELKSRNAVLNARLQALEHSPAGIARTQE